MIDDAAETPTPSRRSIPPVADWGSDAASSPSGSNRWGWVLGTLWISAVIPLGLHWYGTGTPAPAMAQAAVDETTAVAAVTGSRGQVVVPAAAVTEIDGKATVLVAEQSLHLLVATPVELGPASGADREILSGIAAGQLVVTNGPLLRTTASR